MVSKPVPRQTKRDIFREMVELDETQTKNHEVRKVNMGIFDLKKRPGKVFPQGCFVLFLWISLELVYIYYIWGIVRSSPLQVATLLLCGR